MRKSTMTFSRLLAASGLLLVVAGCTPSIPETPSPKSIITAVFDPVGGDIPLPSILVLQDPDALPVPAAQKDLLKLFKANGGFPSDQEVAVTITLAEDVINPDGSTTRVAPQIDPASFTSESLVVFRLHADGSPPDEVPLDPVQPGDLVPGPATVGAGRVTVLSLHHQGRAPWEPGTYAALLRGGNSGVKAVGGAPVWASSVFFLVAQRQDMTKPDNLGLLQAQTGSYDAALALANQLNGLIAAFGPAFDACDRRFPHQELAALALFPVAAKHTVVELDPARGLVPLPIDLLRDPRPASGTCAACGKLTPLAACTLAAGTFNPTTGACSSAAAAGFAALDGFSTTAPLLAPTSDLVLAATVKDNYRLYDLTNPAAPALVLPSTYLTEPVEFTSSGLSPVVASQPVGATAADPTSPFRSKPLKDDTNYAVVITTGVKDKTGTPLGRGTVGSILLFDNPLVDAAGKSQLSGVDDPTAGALEVMRQRLLPVRAALAAETTPVLKADIAMAYTFKTQSILGVATNLAALPYATDPATGQPGAVTVLTPAQAFAQYGVSPGAVAGGNVLAATSIQEVLETTITTFNLLDPATGAFNPAGPQAETVKVLIAVPKVTSPAPFCSGTGGPKCAPMMVFRHGLGGGRADMLTVADTFAAKGMVTVAIDAAKHGDRSFCAKGDTTISVGGGTFPVCSDGAACVSTLPAGAQGDQKPPGTCSAGFTRRPVDLACMADPACGWTGADGIPLTSASFLVTANFFRTRDTLRQDIIDQSQLIRAIAIDPTSAAAATHTVFNRLVGGGIIINPLAVYYSGQSMGAIQGTVDVATNPRISKAVLNVGGGTLVDIFTTSPAFSSSVNQLLAGMGISPGTSQYLQFLAVAKLILDPADPINFAGHLTDPASMLPNLLASVPAGTPPPAQLPKKILTQAALCDQTVPNTWNYVLASNAGTGPLPGAATFGGPGTFQLFFKLVGGPPTPSDVSAAISACAVPGGTSTHAVEHGFFTDWVNSGMTAKAQSDAGDFVVSDTTPTSLVVLP
jgi:hypothetical protein